MNTSAFVSFVTANKKPLAMLIGAILVIGIAGLLWNEARVKRDREATNLLFEVQAKARELETKKNFAEAAKAFEPVLAKFPGSRAAYEAELHIGDLWMDAGSHDQAAVHYEKAARAASDGFSEVLARYNLGIALESAGKYLEAVASYQKALDARGSEFLKPEILMAQARCYESLNQDAKAVEIYKTVQEKFASKTYYSGAASAFEKQLTAKSL